MLLFRLPVGAELYGVLPTGGIGELVTAEVVPNLDLMWHQCQSSNSELLASLREDVNAGALQAIAQEDYELGRMTRPQPVMEADLNRAR